MTVYKKLVDKIIELRSVRLGDLLGERGLDLKKSVTNADDLLEPLDRIFYTLEFLKIEGLINIKEISSNQSSDIFQVPVGDDENKVSGIVYYYDKLKESYGWNIEIKPGLIHFQQQGYQTDERLKQKKQFWLTIGVAISASAITAILTALLTKSPIISC